MTLVSVTAEMDQPTIEEMNRAYPKMPCNSEQKEAIFNIVTEPENIHRALILVEEAGCSPLLYYAKKLQEKIENRKIAPLSHSDKQFTGAAIRLVMYYNYWDPTGVKQRFQNKLFSTGERFKKAK